MVALRSQGNWRWEGPLGTPLGLVHWKRASGSMQHDFYFYIPDYKRGVMPFKLIIYHLIAFFFPEVQHLEIHLSKIGSVVMKFIFVCLETYSLTLVLEV